MVKLGNKVRDLITGFEGVAIARTEYLYGCVHICIAPKLGADGKRPENEWFDEQRVEVVEDTPVPVAAGYSATTGGPADAPPARPTPSFSRA